MHDALLVDKLKRQAYLNEYAPHLGLTKLIDSDIRVELHSHLFRAFEVLFEVALIAILHDQVQFVPIRDE